MKRTAILTLALFLFSAAVKTDPVDDKNIENTQTYSLFGSGDTMLGRWVHYPYYQKGPNKAFSSLRNLILEADIAFTNLESVISTQGRFWDKRERRPYMYRGRPELLDMLTAVGFDLLVTANNHAMDYGPEALLEQLDIIEATGMAQVGAGPNLSEARRPTYLQVDDLIIAFIGLLDYDANFAATDDRAGVFFAKGNGQILAALREPIAQARTHADLVVFTPHWGANWTDNPTAERVALAHGIIDMGVDAILGHSSHHLHGVEIYRGKPIVYDMGSFFFDTVGQSRMRYSAGFLLDFDEGGFKRLRVYPVRLHASRSELARNGDRKKIHQLIKRLSKDLHPGLDWKTEEGGALVLEFAPEEPPPRRRGEPDKVYRTGRTRNIPDAMRKRKTNVVLHAPPSWSEEFEPVRLEQGVTVMGARTSDAVWPRRAFTAEIALRVSGPLKNGDWSATVKGVRRGGGGEFVWRHPIADGGWLPNLWEKGQIVVDRTLVRPTKVRSGVYDLYWRLDNMTKRTWAKPVGSNLAIEDGFLPIGEIRITRRGIPSGPAGVSWDGWLPHNPAFNPGQFHAQMVELRPKHYELVRTAIQVGVIVLFFILIVGVRWIRRRR